MRACDKVYFKLFEGAFSTRGKRSMRSSAQHATRGSISSTPSVARSCWLALAELKHRRDMPTKVVINEAVELAKRYGAAEGFRFVNAVLDKSARELRRAQAGPGMRPMSWASSRSSSTISRARERPRRVARYRRRCGGRRCRRGRSPLPSTRWFAGVHFPRRYAARWHRLSAAGRQFQRPRGHGRARRAGARSR